MASHAILWACLFLTAAHSLVLHPTQRAVDPVESYSHRHWVEHGMGHTTLLIAHSNLTSAKIARLGDLLHKRQLNYTHAEAKHAQDSNSNAIGGMLHDSLYSIMGFLQDLIYRIDQTKNSIQQETRKRFHNPVFY